MDTINGTIEIEDRYQIPTYAKMPVVLVRGEGSYVWDAEGRRLLDFYGGHCVTLLGHCPPLVVSAVQEQASRLMFYSNVVYSSTRAQAAESLAAFAPPGVRKVFFCNSGTEANETALKLARKHTGKPHAIAMTGGFHGRTLGSLAVTWNESYRAPYRDLLPHTTFVSFGSAREVEQVLEERRDVAAVILEPIQSMAGVVDAPAPYYQQLREICDRYGALLIFDEVQTGVGRTGTFTIGEQFHVRPDLITLAKSLGSGIPVGAVLVSDEIAASVKSGDQGTTFGGGMIAMAAVEATLRTIREENLMSRAAPIFDRVSAGLRGLVTGIRGRGCLIGLILDGPSVAVRKELFQRGVITGGADDPNVIRLMPPLNTPPEAVDEFIGAFEMAFEAVAT